MKIYISLPIETNGFDIPTQRKKAKATQLILEAEGQEVINPFDIYDRLAIFGVPKRREVMNADIEELLKCDAIFLSLGWGLSDGCIEEAHNARKKNLQVIFEELKPKGTVYDSLIENLASTNGLSLQRSVISQEIVNLYNQLNPKQ